MTKTEALEKLRSHLDRCGNHSVVITENMALYWWNVANVALFQKKLYPPTRIIIKRFKDWGLCHALSRDSVEIELNSTIPTRVIFLSTLIHEMVHQWENQMFGQMGHGKRFTDWAKRVETILGLDIYSEADEDDYIYGKIQLYKRRY